MEQSNILRFYRAKRQMTVEQLAEKSGVHKSTVSRLENKMQKAELRTILRIAEALEIPPETLEYLVRTEKRVGRRGNSPKAIAA